MNAYITSWVLYLSGGSEDPCLLLPAWISIATVRLSLDYDLLSLIGLLLTLADLDVFISHDSPPSRYPQRDFPLHIRLLHSQFH